MSTTTSITASGASRSLVSRMLAGAAMNRLTLLVICYLVAKYTLYSKIGPGYLLYADPENSFFPKWLYSLNPMYIDFALIGLLIAGSRLALMVAVPLSFLLIVHPHTFGYQHYVMGSYMFLWLAVRDEDTGSVWFGRVTLSFLYMAATIGKSTPGWISGHHYGSYLHHLHQNPWLILGGEFVFGLSFLLPFFLGIVVPACIVFGMIYSISWGIFDAVGPILGMLATFVVYHEFKRGSVSVTLPDTLVGRAVVRMIDYLGLGHVTAMVGERAVATIDGETREGRAAWAALFERVPVLCPLCPIVEPRRLMVYR